MKIEWNKVTWYSKAWAVVVFVIVLLVGFYIGIQYNQYQMEKGLIINKKHMKGYVTNIEEKTIANDNFREVLYTSKNSQLVLMSLLPGEEIGMEVHTLDQFIRVEKGNGVAILDGVEHQLVDGSAVVVPAGANHNIINTSESEDLKLYTIYSPAEHQDGVIFKTKAEAESVGEHFDGKTTE